MSKEPIQELSKRTLASYVRKAHVSGTDAAANAEDAFHRKNSATSNYERNGATRQLHRANKTGEKREKGINMATSKLVSEIVDSIMDNDLEAMKKAVHSVLAEKAKEALDARKKQLGESYFKEAIEA